MNKYGSSYTSTGGKLGGSRCERGGGYGQRRKQLVVLTRFDGRVSVSGSSGLLSVWVPPLEVDGRRVV